MLRLLWSKPYVTFEGRYHKLDNVGHLHHIGACDHSVEPVVASDNGGTGEFAESKQVRDLDNGCRRQLTARFERIVGNTSHPRTLAHRLPSQPRARG